MEKAEEKTEGEEGEEKDKTDEDQGTHTNAVYQSIQSTTPLPCSGRYKKEYQPPTPIPTCMSYPSHSTLTLGVRFSLDPLSNARAREHARALLAVGEASAAVREGGLSM